MKDPFEQYKPNLHFAYHFLKLHITIHINTVLAHLVVVRALINPNQAKMAFVSALITAVVSLELGPLQSSDFFDTLD